MRNDYSSKLATILKEARPKLALTRSLEFKSVFGAIGGYVDGEVFISCGKFGIALKLPPKTLESVLEERGVKHLRYFPKGHIKKEYAVLPKWILEDRKYFRKLVDKSVRYTNAI